MDPLTLLSLGTGLIGGIGQLFGTNKANKQLQDLQSKNDALADSRLGLANTLLQARAPGAAMAERNIFSNQANQVGRVNQNATSSSDALLADAAIGGQTNDALNKLQTAETDDYQRRYTNLGSAQDAKLQSLEGDAQLEGAQRANNYRTWGNISNLGFGMADLGMAGGFKNLFKNNGGTTQGASAMAQTPNIMFAPNDNGTQLPSQYNTQYQNPNMRDWQWTPHPTY